jgi:hypothetical protein
MTVISASDLNTDLSNIPFNVLSAGSDAGVLYSFSLDTLDLISTTNVGLRTHDFTAPDDAFVTTLHLRVINTVVASKTITATLTAISSDETSVPDYLNQQTVSAAVTFSTAATHFASSDHSSTSLTPVVLVKGITYRLTLTNSGASNVDRAVAVLSVRSFKRRA